MRWSLLLAPAVLAGSIAFLQSGLDRHTGALQKAQSAKFVLTVTQVGGSTEEQTLSLSKPNRFRWETPSRLVVSDGKTVTSYDKLKKVFSRTETAAALEDDAVWAWGAFFNSEFGKDSLATKGESRKVKNVPVTDYAVLRPDKRVFVLPIDDATGVARGARYSVENAGGKVETIVLAKEMTLGEAPLEDGLFAWTPPADAKDAAELAKEQAATALHFADIKPILDTNCVSCHGMVAPKGGINMTSYATLIESGAVRKGNPNTSRMMRELRSGKMPPTGPLAAEQIEKLAKWIADGALE